MPNRILLYYVKYPEPGKVKTRLARKIGDEKAAGLYRELAEKNFTCLRKLSPHYLTLAVLFDPPEKEAEVKLWLPMADLYVCQQGKDLGARLAHGFQYGFDNGAHFVAALGSDTQGLRESVLVEAFSDLGAKEAVLGPVEDGGYYLIGLTNPNSAVFENIEWSTPRVFEQTVSRLTQAQLSYSILETLSDLDDETSLSENVNWLI